MSAENDNVQSFVRRTILLGIGGGAVFCGLAARMYHLQVRRAEDYRTLSENNRFNFRTVVPPRGRILDRNGVQLAGNRQDFRVVLIPERVDDLDATLARLSKHIPISEDTDARIRKDISRNRKFTPVLIAEHLSWESFSAINLDLPDLPGVLPLSGETRDYPKDGTFSHVVGYVGTPSRSDIGKDNDPLLRQPTFQIGKTGVEQSADTRLRGKAGRLKVEVNALGRVVREWPEEEGRARSGDAVYLTVDAQLQAFTAEQFGDDSGGAALMDVNTGELRALLSMPLYDANKFVSGISQADLDKLYTDPKKPEYNKVLSGTYPPASTFKMAVAMAGLEAGVINPAEQIRCKGHTQLGNRRFHCWKRRGHGPVDLHNSIKQSCDIYFYEVAQRIGMEKIRNMSERLGLGQIHPLGIAGQSRGILPDDAWKQKRLGDAWRTGDTFNASIGQGFVLVTPLQLCVMAARIANGQKAVKPHLVIGDRVPEFDTMDINIGHLDLIRDAMYAVCEVPGGTAYRPGGMGIPKAQMAGKTGTGQVRGISAAERASGVVKNRDLPWKYRDHSLFVGYAPYQAPRFAAACIVEHGQSGAGRAATIVRAMLGKALKSDGFDEAAAKTLLADL